MSRLAVPILGRTLRATGDQLLRAELVLWLKTNQGGWERARFLVDTGSEMTTFPAADASVLDLPMPINPSPGIVHAQTGLEVRSGLLRFRVVGMDQTEYVAPCFFLGDPHAPHTGPTATSPRNLLQPLAVADRLRFTFENNPTSGIPHGEMVVEKR